jgi:hypothetical protein
MSIPTVPGGVPIIGQAVYMACSRGHVERTSGAPFAMVIPGEPPARIAMCRVCWINFVAMFGARPLDDDEIEELRHAGKLDETRLT